MDPVISFLQSLLETQEEDGSFASIGTNLALSLAIQEDARNQNQLKEMQSILKSKNEKLEELEEDMEQMKKDYRMKKRILLDKVNVAKSSNQDRDNIRKKIINHLKETIRNLKAGNECSICLDEIDTKQGKFWVTLDPCGHRICSCCNEKLSQRKCPECRCRIRQSIKNYN